MIRITIALAGLVLAMVLALAGVVDSFATHTWSGLRFAVPAGLIILVGRWYAGRQMRA
jgi:hypothetical protein